MYFCDMKVLYILFGTLSLALGIIGIFLPLLPTTPFLLLTAALYVRSSPRLYNRLLHHKYLGSYIRNFRENKAIPLRAKIISVSLIWITILNCIFFIVPYSMQPASNSGNPHRRMICRIRCFIGLL